LVVDAFADCCLLALSANNRFWGKSGSRFLQYDSVTIFANFAPTYWKVNFLCPKKKAIYGSYMNLVPTELVKKPETEYSANV